MKLIFRDVIVPRPGVRPGERLDVVLNDGTVEAVMPAERSPERHADDIDASGHCLVPGLIDGHVHFPDVPEPVADLLALEYLAHGITSVFCMHGSPAVVRLRNRIAAGQRFGPRITTTGPMQDDPTMTRAQGLAVARDHAALGYDAIKVYSRLSASGFEGIMEGAIAAGMPVVGHVVRSVGLDETLRAPQRHIAHLEEFVYSFLDVSLETLSDSGVITFDGPALDKLAGTLRERGISVGTTIEAIRSAYEQVRDAAAWLAAPDLASLPDAVRSGWLPPNNFYATRFGSDSDVAAFGRIVDLVRRLAGELHQRGVRLVAGTDALHVGVPPGTSMHRELHELVEAGLSDAEAFRSALTPTLGVPAGQQTAIGVGYSGDLVLLGGDPYESIPHIADVRGVYVAGQYLPAARLREMSDHLRASLADDAAPSTRGETA